METYYQVTLQGVTPIKVNPEELRKSESWLIGHSFDNKLIFENYSRAMLCYYEKKAEYKKLNLLDEVKWLIGKPYKSDDKTEYGFGKFVTETIISYNFGGWPPSDNPDVLFIELDVSGTDGNIHKYSSSINKERLYYIWKNIIRN